MVARFLACGVALFCAGCVTYSAAPTPSAQILQPCADPDYLVPDVNTAGAQEINTERLSVAKAFVNCKRMDDDRITWMKALGK